MKSRVSPYRKRACYTLLFRIVWIEGMLYRNYFLTPLYRKPLRRFKKNITDWNWVGQLNALFYCERTNKYSIIIIIWLRHRHLILIHITLRFFIKQFTRLGVNICLNFSSDLYCIECILILSYTLSRYSHLTTFV